MANNSIVRQVYKGTWTFPILLVNMTVSGEVVTDFLPGFAGRIVKWYWIQNTAVTTGGKSAALDLEINERSVTSGVGTATSIALASATCTPLGKVIEGSAIGGGTARFNATDTISIESTVTVAFAEGAGSIVIEYEGKVL